MLFTLRDLTRTDAQRNPPGALYVKFKGDLPFGFIDGPLQISNIRFQLSCMLIAPQRSNRTGQSSTGLESDHPKTYAEHEAFPQHDVNCPLRPSFNENINGLSVR